MTDFQKEHDRLMYEAYERWIQTFAYGLSECSKEVSDEFINLAKRLNRRLSNKTIKPNSEN